MSIARVCALLAAVVVSALAGCGGSGAGDGGASEPPRGGQSTVSAGDEPTSAGERCDDIPVPGHEGTDVRVQGSACAEAVEVVEAAVGKGRRAYEAAGFQCEPSAAAGGDTNYACVRDGARVTFRYGAA